MTLNAYWIVLGCCISAVSAYPSKQPNIIFIIADDMGWNDVSFHGSNQIPTPNIDALAYNGIILNNHYCQSICTPSRAALMTGKYPIHTGMQGDPIYGSETRALPLSERTMAQELKTLGYNTHLIGKWHLGFYKKIYTPLNRGFDSHFGYWTGANSYYDHILQDITPEAFYGYDWRRGFNTSWEADGQYTTDLLTKEAVKVIRSYRETGGHKKPLFLVLAHAAPHSGLQSKLLEAPQSEIDKFRYVKDPNRRTFAAMVSLLDKSIGRVIWALEDNGLLKKSIIVFLADNGAPLNGQIFENWGSNYPFRGDKWTLWEGAVRTPALIWSPYLQSKPRVSNQLLHISDWLPTLFAAAGGDVTKLEPKLDGKNQWEVLSKNLDSKRRQFVININERVGYGAIRVGDYKLIKGNDRFNGTHNGYLNPQVVSGLPAYDASQHDLYRLLSRYSDSAPPPSQLRRQATITCSQEPVNVTCPCLFDISRDPCERVNLYKKQPELATLMLNEYAKYYATLVPQPFSINDLRADPKRFNYTWSSWLS